MPSTAVEHLDVLIVGAGISGIGAAHAVQTRTSRRYAILEARSALGGTWDLFRYPGIRSDSDLYTFGFDFRPWREDESIASADRILAYLQDTAREYGIDRRIRFSHRVVAARWHSSEARWHVDVERTDTGECVTLTANWLFGATGYYRYDRGFSPRFEGEETFRGRIVHPQAWPADLDHRGRRVVVIGSGATAVTLVPALATDAAHVTMLQRTPTYILSAPAKDRIANALRRMLGDDRAHPLVRQKNIAVQRLLWRACRRFPEQARRVIRWTTARQLPAGYPVDEHFSPPYDPWDQRLCLVPDGDFFAAIRSGSASVVTDRVRRFTETGIELESGEELEADIVVTATGLELLPFGGIELTVDGAPVDLTERLAYRGTMLDGVPNFAYAIGYTNASWTLKVGLLCTYFTRVLEHMDRLGYDVCRPARPAGPVLTRPLLDFGAGYVRRAVDRLPKQGERAPWVISMNYYEDVALLRRAPVDDGVLRFERARRATGVTV